MRMDSRFNKVALTLNVKIKKKRLPKMANAFLTPRYTNNKNASNTNNIPMLALLLGTSPNFATIVTKTFTAPRTISIADPGADADIVTTQGTQTISGAKTFNGSVTVNSSTALYLNASAGNGNIYLGNPSNSTFTYIWNSAFRANSAMPTNGGVNLFLDGDQASPVVNRAFIGDGSGWGWYFAKKLAGTVTDLFRFIDTGNLQLLVAGATLSVDRVTAQTSNTNLELRGNGTGIVAVPQTTDATSSTTGTLVVSGGAGIAKNLYVGSSLYLPSTNAGVAASPLNFFTQDATITWTLSGGSITPTSWVGYVTKFANIILIRMPAYTGTLSTASTVTTPLVTFTSATMATYTLANSQSFTVPGTTAGASADLKFVVGTGFSLTITTNTGGTLSGTIGFNSTTITCIQTN